VKRVRIVLAVAVFTASAAPALAAVFQYAVPIQAEKGKSARAHLWLPTLAMVGQFDEFGRGIELRVKTAKPVSRLIRITKRNAASSDADEPE